MHSGWEIGDEAGDHRAKAKKWVHTLTRACGLWDEYDAEGRRHDGDRRRTLFIVNPAAGRGSGVAEFNRLRRVLDAAGADYDWVVTERAGHAREYVRDRVEFRRVGDEKQEEEEEEEDVERYDSVVSVSGDGGLHEILNGLHDKAVSVYCRLTWIRYYQFRTCQYCITYCMHFYIGEGEHSVEGDARKSISGDIANRFWQRIGKIAAPLFGR